MMEVGVFVQFAVTLAIACCVGLLAYACTRRPNVDCQSLSRDHTAGRALACGDRFFLITLGTFLVVFGTLTVLRHLSANTGYDLAQYDQILWNSMNGRLFEQTYILDSPFFLGKSFSPILLAFIPLYAIWTDPVVLLIIQVLALGIAAFPLYWYARSKLPMEMALVVSVAFLLSPAVTNVSLTDFHEIVLAAPLYSFLAFLMLRQQYRPFCACLAVTFLVKEETTLIAVALGLYVAIIQRRWGLGLGISLVGALLGLTLLQIVVPWLRGPDHGSSFYHLATRYAYLGKDLPQVLNTLLTQPGLVLQHVLTPQKIAFVLNLLVPLAFMPLIGVELLFLSFPTFLYSLLSDYAPQFSITYPYTPPLLPFLYFAAVLGLKRLLLVAEIYSSKGRIAAALEPRRISLGLTGLIVTATVISYLLHSVGPLALGFDHSSYAVSEPALYGSSVAAQIPHDAIVVAQGEWVSHLSQRRSIYNVEDPSFFRRADYLFMQQGRPWYSLREASWNGWLSNGAFTVVLQKEGFTVAKRASPQKIVDWDFDGYLELIGFSVFAPHDQGELSFLRTVLWWRAERRIEGKYKVTLRLVDSAGHIWTQVVEPITEGFNPTHDGEVGRPIAFPATLHLPPTMPSGDYEVTLSVSEKGTDQNPSARDFNGSLLGAEIALGTIRIEKNKHSFQASMLQIENPLYVDMGEMRFLGSVPPRVSISPGELFQIGLYWRARGKPQGDYIVAVQFVDKAGSIAYEEASRPAKGLYPTTLWDAGEVLLDWHDFTLPKDMTHGGYEIWVLLRDLATQCTLGRVPVSGISVGP